MMALAGLTKFLSVVTEIIFLFLLQISDTISNPELAGSLLMGQTNLSTVEYILKDKFVEVGGGILG